MNGLLLSLSALSLLCVPLLVFLWIGNPVRPMPCVEALSTTGRWVTKSVHGFSGVFRRHLMQALVAKILRPLVADQNVQTLSDALKMLWVHASPVAALVIYHQTLRNWADKFQVHLPMGAVSPIVQTKRPRPAFIFPVLLPKALNSWKKSSWGGLIHTIDCTSMFNGVQV